MIDLHDCKAWASSTIASSLTSTESNISSLRMKFKATKFSEYISQNPKYHMYAVIAVFILTTSLRHMYVFLRKSATVARPGTPDLEKERKGMSFKAPVRPLGGMSYHKVKYEKTHRLLLVKL
jgi:hypothetical protein